MKQAFDFDKSGRLDPAESAAAQIIVYGQSLGGSATLRLCRWLNEQGIHVRLAVVIDAYGHDPYTVPPNVAVAANLYQRDFGPVRGAPKIVAEDPRQTRIHGNWRYSYKGQDVAMPGEPFLRRWFMGSHLKMEYDPEPWRRVRDLLVSAVNNSGADAICSLPRWVAAARMLVIDVFDNTALFTPGRLQTAPQRTPERERSVVSGRGGADLTLDHFKRLFFLYR